MVEPIPVYSVRGPRGYPDRFYDISRICEMVGNHVPVPLKYEGRVARGFMAHPVNDGGYYGCIHAKHFADRRWWGSAFPGHCFDVYPLWLSSDNAAQIVAHEALHVLGVDHCNNRCIMNPHFHRTAVFERGWYLCRHHRGVMHEIAIALHYRGWEALPI